MAGFIRGLFGTLVAIVIILAAVNLFQGATDGSAPPAQPQPFVTNNGGGASGGGQQPPVQQQPQQPAQVQAPAQERSTGWSCPGQPAENNGCIVTSTTDVPANACVDYDPRGQDHPVGSYDVIDTDSTRQRVLFNQPGQIALAGGRATVYNNNYCPPY